MLRFIANDSYCSHTEPQFFSYIVIKITSVFNFCFLFLLRPFQLGSLLLFLADLANLTNRKSVIDVHHKEFWNVPHFRRNYPLQCLAHNLPTLLNIICMKHIDMHCKTEEKRCTRFVQLRRRELFCVNFLGMFSIFYRNLYAMC